MFGRTHRKGKSNTRAKTQSVVSWSISFENVLEDPEGLKTFQEFLKREFSAENIMFWVACKQFSKLNDPIQMKQLAKEVYDLHLRHGAAEAVNINSHTRQSIMSQLQNPPPDLLTQAEKEIFSLMKFDCYQRFLKSDIFVECLTAEKLGKPLPCSCMSVSKSPSGARFRSKSREKNRTQASTKANSTSFVTTNSNELNVIKDGVGVTTNRRSYLTYKKDLDAVWNRLQNRIDDQRGTELNCDMPEFLLCNESGSVI